MPDANAVHVVPINDLIVHDTKGEEDCVCGPTVEPVKADDGEVGWLLTHHSLDSREAREQRRRSSGR